jgi:hypothetical protein
VGPFLEAMMFLTFRSIVLVSFAVVSLGSAAISAPMVISDVTLDVNSDGKLDRIALVENGGLADLYIFLGAGDAPLDISKSPTFIKKELSYNNIHALAVSGKHAFTIQNGCGGCSNDYETTLTIVDRGGTFLVAGYTLNWDTRNGQGSCDINFLTGKGTLARDLGEGKHVKGQFKPIKLADWTDEYAPKICQN